MYVDRLAVMLFCLCVKAFVHADDAEVINRRFNICYRGNGAGAHRIRRKEKSKR